jgi:hypothetical protein
VNLGFHTTNWKHIENRKCTATDEVELILEKCWQEILAEAKTAKTVALADLLRIAWPRTGK